MAALDFKPVSESYLKRLRMPIQRGEYGQPKQFYPSIPEKEIVKYHSSMGVTPATPHRDDYGHFDRTNGGYLSAAGREDRNMKTSIPSMADNFDEKPQQNLPEEVKKARPMTSLQPTVVKVESDLRVKCRAKSAVVGPTSWQDRGETKNVLRGKMIYSGWKDPETGTSELYKKPDYEADKQKQVWSEPSLNKVIYRSATQRQMDEVNWDSKVPLPLPPPETTVEKHADPVNEKLRQIMQNKKEAPSDWQVLAKGWDYNQMRNQYLHQRRPYSYSSNYKTHQIPNYQGHCGGLGEIDDTYSSFYPLEVKRNDIPPYYGTGRSANIPGYTGNIWWLGLLPAHKYKPEKSQTTTFNIHSKMQTVAKSAPPSEYARREKLMKLVTTVPPHNPFRRSAREMETVDPLDVSGTKQSVGGGAKDATVYAA